MAHRVVPAAIRFAPLLALALLAAGCGKSKERELYEQREAACASVLGLTVSQARPVMLHREDIVDCPADLNRIDETDTCGGSTSGPYTEVVCRVLFLWIANDPGLCNDASGCTYGCVARVTPGDATSLDDVTICARSWLP